MRGRSILQGSRLGPKSGGSAFPAEYSYICAHGGARGSLAVNVERLSKSQPHIGPHRPQHRSSSAPLRLSALCSVERKKSDGSLTRSSPRLGRSNDHMTHPASRNCSCRTPARGGSLPPSVFYLSIGASPISCSVLYCRVSHGIGPRSWSAVKHV